MSMKSPTNELFISVDIEADGPIPIKNSMIAIGAVPFTSQGVLSDHSFEMALRPLDAAVTDPDTMKWWAEHPAAWEYIHATIGSRDIKGGLIPADPKTAMLLFNDWVEEIAAKYKSRPRFAGYPASFDHMFVYIYSHYLLGRCSFNFTAFDAKSYAMGILKTSFSDTVKSKMPKEWFNGLAKHNHKPAADALEQAQLMIRMMNYGK